MDDLASLESQLVELRDARAGGHHRIRFGDREVWYRNDRELAAAIADLERRIAILRGQRVHSVRLSTSKGIHK